MTTEETTYLSHLAAILREGNEVPDRTGVGVKFLPGMAFRYSLQDNRVPIWTTRRVPWKNQVWELLWFLNGRTDVAWLQSRGVRIWDSWALPDGTIGPGYGKQWRNWQSGGKIVDQFANLIHSINTNPFSRRHIVSLWNPADVDLCALPPCHGLTIQFIVDGNRGLHCLQYQRSADMPLGYCPWQYALLTHIVGRLTNTTPTSLTVTVGHGHIYLNQLQAVEELLKRTPTEFPTLKMNDQLKTISDIENSTLGDYELVGYSPQPFIKFPIAV